MAWNSYCLFKAKIRMGSGGDFKWIGIFSDYPFYFGGSDAIYTHNNKTYYNSGVNLLNDGYWLNANVHCFSTNVNATIYYAITSLNSDTFTNYSTSRSGMVQTGSYYVLAGDMYNNGYLTFSTERYYDGQYDWSGDIVCEYPDSIFRYNQTGFINYITTGLQPPYNWQSVPSVSGKNGILSLAQIASDSINDGEPVSDAAATAFSDLPAECNVGEIIDDLLPYEESLVDVLVKYKVKGAVTGAFEYVKLVAKKGSIPKSVEDGDKVVDINPSKKSKLVTGLDEGSKYYFVIFVKDSADQTAKSNEKSIETGYLEHNGWELVNKIKFKDGSEFTFNVPDNLKNPVINYLNTNELEIDMGIEVIPKGHDANINNYNITSFPLQANAAETNIDSVHYFNDNHTDILQLWYAQQLQQYSIVAGGYAIANASNMCSNDYGGYCLCPFINRSEHKAIFGYFTTAYRLEVDKDIYYVNWFANDAQSYEEKSELLYDALMEVI